MRPKLQVKIAPVISAVNFGTKKKEEIETTGSDPSSDNSLLT